jgi:hypothetical protein
MSTDESLIIARDALRVLMSYNRMRNDLEAYLYAVAQYGLGEIEKQPNPEDYGVEPIVIRASTGAGGAP